MDVRRHDGVVRRDAITHATDGRASSKIQQSLRDEFVGREAFCRTMRVSRRVESMMSVFPAVLYRAGGLLTTYRTVGMYVHVNRGITLGATCSPHILYSPFITVLSHSCQRAMHDQSCVISNPIIRPCVSCCIVLYYEQWPPLKLLLLLLLLPLKSPRSPRSTPRPRRLRRRWRRTR